jgi:lysophospholipase L1-like esterase
MLDKIENKLKKSGKYRIGFVGDSLTSCEWVHPNWREMVEYVLKEELQKKFSDYRIPSWGIRCFNWGFDGSTTSDIVNKLDEIVEVKPDLIISLMGGNDPELGVKPEETKNNLEKIFKKFEENNIEYYWSTSIADLSDNKTNFYQPYREVTLSFGHTLDIFEWYKQWDLNKFFTFKEGSEMDPLHPNQLGNAYIAKYFLEKIFEINFDPEKFMEMTLKGEKYPEY